MGKLRFYHIDEKYVEYLHQIDNRVQMNKGERRPYVGIVLKIGKCNYYVPLESPKENHANIRSGGPVLKLDEGRLGIMGFNNMIPVHKEQLININFQEIEDARYRNLLYNQYEYCEKNKELIFFRAKTVYEKTTGGNTPFYRKVCCNFVKLEKAARKYQN